MRSSIAAAGAAALLLAGCGGGGSHVARQTTTTAAPPAPKPALVAAGLDPPDGCYVALLLVDHATKAQVARVRRELLSSGDVTEISFVPRALQLRRLALTDPKAAKGMSASQFVDGFEVVPRSPAAAVSLAGRFGAGGGPVATVKPSRGCGAA